MSVPEGRFRREDRSPGAAALVAALGEEGALLANEVQQATA